jgi:hypothetical protein
MEKPKQQTPQGETIPVPTREAVFDDLTKVAGKAKQDNEPTDSDAGESGAEDQQGE